MAGFEQLRIWQKAHELMIRIHNLAKALPFEEKFRLKAQIERSSSSVCDNIAEGYSSYYYNDKIKGMYTARKEAGETQNHLKSFESKKYIKTNLAEELNKDYEGLIKGINAYINYVRDKRKSDKTNK